MGRKKKDNSNDDGSDVSVFIVEIKENWDLAKVTTGSFKDLKEGKISVSKGQPSFIIAQLRDGDTRVNFFNVDKFPPVPDNCLGLYVVGIGSDEKPYISAINPLGYARVFLGMAITLKLPADGGWVNIPDLKEPIGVDAYGCVRNGKPYITAMPLWEEIEYLLDEEDNTKLQIRILVDKKVDPFGTTPVYKTVLVEPWVNNKKGDG